MFEYCTSSGLVLILAPLFAVPLMLFNILPARLARLLTMCLTALSICGFMLYIPQTSHGLSLLINCNLDFSHELFEFSSLALVCGLLFNIAYFLCYLAFGERVFIGKNAAYWVLTQTLLSMAALVDQLVLLAALVILATASQLYVSEKDVYQLSRRGEEFLLNKFYTIIALFLLLIFVFAANYFNHVYSITDLHAHAEYLSGFVLFIGSLLLMLVLGIFPLNSWVNPLFTAPTRYGLGAIARLQLGFTLWCKIGFIINLISPEHAKIVVLLLGLNFVYAALLLFNQKRLTQILSALYSFHITILLLAGFIAREHLAEELILSFANAAISLTGLLLIIGMLRDRMGAESLRHASGIAISYPIFGMAFLLCMLSLIGFPGTLGFISSEMLLHHLAESNWLVAGMFILAIALNGYSSFRIFGESFYGSPEQSYRKAFQPLLREKLAIAIIVLFILLNGISVQSISKITAYIPSLISEARADDDTQAWLAVIASGALTKKNQNYRWYLEGQPRVGRDIEHMERLLLRGAFGYKITPKLTAWLGYAWTPLFMNGQLESEFINENRIWQQLSYDDSLLGLTANHRLRLEQRFLEGQSHVADRVRYMLKLSKPLGEFHNSIKYGLTGYDELFWNIDSLSAGPQNGMDRNRIFFGPYIAKDHTRLELGYLNELGERPGKSDRQIQAIACYLIMNF